MSLEGSTAVGLFEDKEGLGPSVHTFTGGRFYVLNPRPEDVDLLDIAQALSNQCRFNGHTKSFYSVAQHSVLVAEHLMEQTGDIFWALTGLLHDAAEAYMGDITRPLKELLSQKAPGLLAGIEDRIEDAVLIAFDLYGPLNEKTMWKAIKAADNAVLSAEYRDLLTPTRKGIGRWGHDLPKPIEKVIVPLPPEEACDAFVATFDELWEKIGRRQFG